jgi:hypothetical protein
MLVAAHKLHGPEHAPPDRYTAKRPQIALQLEQSQDNVGNTAEAFHEKEVSLIF